MCQRGKLDLGISISGSAGNWTSTDFDKSAAVLPDVVGEEEDLDGNWDAM